mgnify:CR=1 FL=1
MPEATVQPIDESFEPLQKELREKNTTSLFVLGWLSTTLVPAFWALDWVLIPQHVVLLGCMRLGLTLYGLWLLMTLRHRREWVISRVHLLGPITILAIEVTISAMCWLHEGYESQYYAGVCLSVLASGTLFLWDLRTAATVYATMYVVYMLPLAFGVIAVNQPAVVLNNQFFLLSTIIIVIASQVRRYQLERAEFFTKRSLGETKGSLETALSRLQELDKAKSNFFNNVTHELRTPLTMILSPLENILSGDLGRIEVGHEAALKLIWRNALKLLKLINDLLDLARLEEQFLRLGREPMDLGKLVKDILDHTAPLAARKNIDVVYQELDSAEGFCIDTGKLERVLVNIIATALKFTEPGGLVRITVDVRDDVVYIAIADTGVGIGPDKLVLIFERFSQGDASVTRRFGGTGIGLAFAREIIRLHGGDITVESEIGVGSTFTVSLPRGVADVVEVPSVEARRSGPVEWAQQLLERSDYRFLDVHEVTERRIVDRGDDTGKATKVLVVEDNVELLRFLHLQLHDQHAVYLARNGEAGLELARRERPDVIVSDFMMDRMDGLTMIRELRASPETADIPVILLTAERSVETRLSAREAGADIYLEKPFSPRELRAAVESLLRRRGREVQQVLRAQVRSLETVSGGLAHEIRNPLTYIKNAVFVIAENAQSIERVLKADVTPEARDQVIAKSISRMERMRTTADRGIERIEQVLETVRRYARDGYPNVRMPREFDAMVTDVVALLRPKGDRHVDVQLDLQATGWTVECVADELQQVVRNLLQNAIDASEDGAVVHGRTRVERDGVLFQVQDKGHGIPREIQSRIFTPFFSTKAPGDGMGLGLAIVDQVVRDHEGRVQLESVPGAGTTFTVWLPAAPPVEALAA